MTTDTVLVGEPADGVQPAAPTPSIACRRTRSATPRAAVRPARLAPIVLAEGP